MGDAIDDAQESLNSMGQQSAQSVLDGANETFDSHSPSRAMYTIGSDAVQGLLNAFTDLLKDITDAGSAAGTQIMTGLQSGAQGFWDGTLHEWFAGAGQWVIDAIAEYKAGGGGDDGPSGWLFETGQKVLGSLQTGIQNLWDTVTHTGFANFGQTVINAIGEFKVGEVAGPAGWLIQTGKDILKGMQDGIDAALTGPKGFWDWLKTTLIDQIPIEIRRILNLDADTGAMALVGERMVRELEIGIENRWPTLEGLLGRLGKSLANADLGGWNLPDDEVEDYIRRRAPEYGIPVEDALDVWRGEGRQGYVGDYGSSFGPYQLHYGGIAEGGNSGSGLGDTFTSETGYSAIDPSTWRRQIDWVLNYAAHNGWQPWHGAPERLQEMTGYSQGGLVSEYVEGTGSSGRRYAFHGTPGRPEAVLDAETTAALRSGKSGGSVDTDALVSVIVKALAATRPIIVQGTSEQVIAEVRTILKNESRDTQSLRGGM